VNRRVVWTCAVALTCACAADPPAPEPPPVRKRPRATWTASTPRTPPPPDSKLSEPSGRVRVTLDPNARRQQAWALAGGADPGPPLPGEISGYELVPNNDPNCPGWVAVPRYAPQLPDEPAGEEAPELPEGHGMTLPPPPEPEPPAPPPEVEETLRPTEAGR